MGKFKKGDTVRHNFSKVEGEVLQTRRSGHYRVLVRWFGYIDADWYTPDVLEAI